MKRVIMVIGAAVVMWTSYNQAEAEKAKKKEKTQKTDGFKITVTPNDPIGWAIRIDNQQPENISLVWDESIFTDGTGRSLGHVFPMTTRRSDIGKPLLALTVAPGGFGETDCLSEAMVQWLDDRTMKSGEGTLRLVIQTSTAKQVWARKVTYGTKDPDRNVGVYCFATEWCLGQCYKTRDSCEPAARAHAKHEPNTGMCQPTPHMYCASSFSGDEVNELRLCMPSKEACVKYLSERQRPSSSSCVEE